MLYPLFFKPISKERLWGGRKLMDFLNKPFYGNEIGESWELSAVSGDRSVVSHGPLQGKPLNELIEVYKADLVGKSVYERFGNDFRCVSGFRKLNFGSQCFAEGSVLEKPA